MPSARSIVVDSRRKSVATLQKAWPGATLIDVTSKGPEPWVRFSPFWPHGGIPIPNSPQVTAQSVEGLWQGLKVFEKADIDPAKWAITSMKNIKRSARSLGAVRGHRFGVDSPELLGYHEARLQIYLPAYRWILDHKLTAELDALRNLPGDLVLLDYETNSNVDDLSKPLSHASLIKRYLEGTWPGEVSSPPALTGDVSLIVATIGSSFVHVGGEWATSGIEPGSQCLVSSRYLSKITSTVPPLELDTSECTVWTVRHCAEQWPQRLDQSRLERLLEQSIHAISELVRWQKGNELQPAIAPQLRGLGRLDVKAALAVEGNTVIALWLNPRFQPPSAANAALGKWLPRTDSNGIMTPNPFGDPFGPYATRLLSAYDLYNMGFYTEAVVAAFSLVDDLVQRVVLAGLTKSIEDEKERETLMRSIERERLKLYTGSLMQLCGWKRLDVANPQLYSRLVGAPKTSTNKIRNEIMHGSLRLQRAESRSHLETILEAIRWLQGNPFGVEVGPVPIFHDAQVAFEIYERDAG